jgi:hypothetical protein
MLNPSTNATPQQETLSSSSSSSSSSTDAKTERRSSYSFTTTGTALDSNNGGSCRSGSSSGSFHVLEGDDTSTNTLLPCVLDDLEHYYVDPTNADPRKMAETWNALGLIRLHTQGNAVAALQCHEQALQSLQQSQPQSIHQSQQQPQQPLLLYPIEQAITLNDMGYCYERLIQQDRALATYEQALRLLLQQKGVDESHPRLISIRRSMCRLQRE